VTRITTADGRMKCEGRHVRYRFGVVLQLPLRFVAPRYLVRFRVEPLKKLFVFPVVLGDDVPD
jgi:hypothetical protein